jgi:hypothetical protein
MVKHIAATCVVVISLAACAGTQQSDARTYYSALQTYNSVMEGLIVAIKADKFDTQEIKNINRARRCASGALDTMRGAALDDVPGNIADSTNDALQRCLDNLIVELAQTENGNAESQ